VGEAHGWRRGGQGRRVGVKIGRRNTVLENIEPAAVGRGKGGNQVAAADAAAPASGAVLGVVVALLDGATRRRGGGYVVVVTPAGVDCLGWRWKDFVFVAVCFEGVGLGGEGEG